MATGRRFSLGPLLAGRDHPNPTPTPRSTPPAFRLRLRRVLRKGWKGFTSDKVAAAHMVYFLISAALFLPLIGGMLYFMRDVTDSQLEDDVGLEPRARSLLDRLMSGPGALENGSTYWQDRDPGDKLVEAGIRHDEERRRLSHEKLANLQRGGLETDPTTPFVDYPELKEALALTKYHDFHLRLTPTGHDRSVDPYGAKPLGQTHVAYFGAVSDPPNFSGDTDMGEFTAAAQKEAKALEALGLGYTEAEAGFTPTPYFPAECPGTGTQHGTVIGNSAKDVTARGWLGSCSLGSETKPYSQWFLDDYFWDDDGDYRFDALIFGTGVDLQFWMNEAVSSDETSAHLFLQFVEAGGTIIFMDATQPGTEFVSECTEDHCLLNQEGGFPGLDSPDTTNQMLFAPNRVHDDLPLRGTPWRVCDMELAGGVDETKGFIPVILDEASPDGDCMLVHFGATASDRYGATGGTVILANWDLLDVVEDDQSRIFANLLSYGILRTAYLDYGPQLPEDRSVRVVARTSVLELPTGEFVEVRAQVYVWRS